MKKSFAVMLALSICIASPQIVKALVSFPTTIVFKNAETGNYLHYLVNATVVQPHTNRINPPPSHISGFGYGLDVPDEFFGNVDQLNATVFVGRYCVEDNCLEEVGVHLTKGEYHTVELPAANVCGDWICSQPENSDNCPEDCYDGCGDGRCDMYIEDSQNCPLDCSSTFIRGDANRDGAVTNDDGVMVIYYAYYGKTSPHGVPPCLDAADANDDGRLDMADYYAINAAVNGGSLPAPYPGYGIDPTPTDPFECGN